MKNITSRVKSLLARGKKVFEKKVRDEKVLEREENKVKRMRLDEKAVNKFLVEFITCWR